MKGGTILTERQLIKMMRDEYQLRLLEMMGEADVFDKEGNLVVGRDLKVRHKKSQYEYTIDDVIEDSESGNVKIVLRLPDEPRFPAPPEDPDILINDQGRASLLDEEELIAPPASNKFDGLAYDDSPQLFIINQEEFEKEYEVK